jgi:RHS repeat-associated protein
MVIYIMKNLVGDHKFGLYVLFENSRTDLPVVLLELDASDFSVKKAYIYGNSQIIAQYDGNPFSANKYFYLHDRLGSVRQLINQNGAVVVMYTYNPFGETIESDGTFCNPFRFTGQYYDSEISQYYLRARQYEPHLGRFVSRDPVLGQFDEPLTLHKYLYSENNPINLFDPNGASSRSAALGYRQFTSEHYTILWNNKIEPFDANPYKKGIETLVKVIGKEAIKYYIPKGSSALLPVWGGAGFIAAGPNMYVITYYRLLQHGMINALWRDFFGYDLGLYDIQDFWAGL